MSVGGFSNTFLASLWFVGSRGRWPASCPPTWRAYGLLAPEVGGPRAVPQLSPRVASLWSVGPGGRWPAAVPPAVPPAVILQRFARQIYEKQCEKQSRTLQLELSRILHRGRRPLTCFVLGPRRILEWHHAFKRINPKSTYCPKTELLGVILPRCNWDLFYGVFSKERSKQSS